MPAPVQIGRLSMAYERFEMLEGEVTFSEAYFHLSCVKAEDYHNAYDADENFTLFRADAVFTHQGKDYVVPVYAMQQVRGGPWTWRFRFQPHLTGSWRVRIRVLCWHTTPGTSEQPEARRNSRSSGSTYYEHEFGSDDSDYTKHPGAQRSFEVRAGEWPGPLETPNTSIGDNSHYFYRYQKVDGKYQRSPFFLVGMARPWNVLDSVWDNFLDWDRELFGAMSAAGCNLLYHWMAPWENHLTHQAVLEYWPDAHDQIQTPAGNSRLSGANKKLGYKRYDQGRALLTDHILAKSQNHNVLTLLSVITHQSLQDERHRWGEHGWRSSRKGPSELNGFQLFPHPATGAGLAIEDFFQMSPEASAASWKRQLWKHFANFWRYVIARWTASPALAGWVLIDELEGVGTDDNFWWSKRGITGPWHNNLLKMLRGKLTWQQEGKSFPYTGDYLHHPLTITTTYYQYPGNASSQDDARMKIERGGELPEHGNWCGTPVSWLGSSSGPPEQLDFLSNHTYPYVPTWGTWNWASGGRRVYQVEGRFTGWYLPNTSGQEHINVDRWFWDALCMRLRNWSQVNTSILKPKLVTEYGSIERGTYDPITQGYVDGQVQKWDHYGQRSPSQTHFANWSGLMLGYAGVPLKWSDGKEFGEMIGRRSHSAWEPGGLYPVNCYVEMTSIMNFLKGVRLDSMQPKEYRVVAERGSVNADYRVWALADTKDHQLLLVWIYDRTFTIKGRTPSLSWLKIDSSLLQNTVYTYTWFNTWDGRDKPGGTGRVVTNSEGILILPLPAFPRASDLPGRSKTTVSSADGNDIALRLVKVEQI